MEPTSHQPYSGTTGSANQSHGTTAHSSSTSPVDPTFSTTAAHATGGSPTPSSQPAASGVQGKLTDALDSGKKWLANLGVAEQAQQLPQKAKDLGNQAWTSISGLTTTQKAVGVGVLAAAIAFLATRGKGKKDAPAYRDRPRKSPFDHQPHTKDGDFAYDRRGQGPRGASRYAQTPTPTSKARVSSGSGYETSDHGASAKRPPAVGQRRDQGPASGTQYNASTSGGQNPNNLDQLNSAY